MINDYKKKWQFLRNCHFFYKGISKISCLKKKQAFSDLLLFVALFYFL